MGSRAELLETLRKAAATLREVEERKMFGCEALFTRGSIFALVWKTGRIGVKLPDEGRFGELARQKGAEPWRAGPMVMAHWLLVPPSLEDAKKLAPWVKEAHEMAAAGLGKLKVPKKIRGVKRGDQGARKRETKMAAKKSGNQDAIASAGDALANTPQAARTVAEEVVRAVTKVAKAAAGAAKAVVKKGKKKAAGAKKKAGAAKKKAGKAVKKVAAKAKKAAKKPAKKK